MGAGFWGVLQEAVMTHFASEEDRTWYIRVLALVVVSVFVALNIF